MLTDEQKAQFMRLQQAHNKTSAAKPTTPAPAREKRSDAPAAAPVPIPPADIFTEAEPEIISPANTEPARMQLFRIEWNEGRKDYSGREATTWKGAQAIMQEIVRTEWPDGGYTKVKVYTEWSNREKGSFRLDIGPHDYKGGELSTWIRQEFQNDPGYIYTDEAVTSAPAAPIQPTAEQIEAANEKIRELFYQVYNIAVNELRAPADNAGAVLGKTFARAYGWSAQDAVNFAAAACEECNEHSAAAIIRAAID